MTTIHFIRHGQSTWNAEVRIQGSSNPPLSELGRSQASAVAGKLPQFNSLYCSDLIRTRQTIELILDGKTENVQYQSQLREIHLGPWEGVLLADAVAQHPEATDAFRNRPDEFELEGAETLSALQKRATDAVTTIVDACPDQTVLIVSHGAFIKALLIDYENIPMRKLWKDPHIDNCGHSIVEYKNGKAKVVKFADRLDW